MSTRSEYHRRYYQEHKDVICERRRQKYANDPAYRERALSSKRHERKEKMWPHSVAQSVGPHSGGCIRKSYTIGEAAKLIGVHRATLLRWIKVGWIPETPYISLVYGRLFTADMIVVLRDMLLQYRPDVRLFRERVADAWYETGAVPRS